MIDLWTLLVVDMFGGFWLAVLGIAFIMWIIFVIGRVSQLTSLNFISLFILSLCVGYGYLLVSIGLTILIIFMHILAVPRLINS